MGDDQLACGHGNMAAGWVHIRGRPGHRAGGEHLVQDQLLDPEQHEQRSDPNPSSGRSDRRQPDHESGDEEYAGRRQCAAAREVCTGRQQHGRRTQRRCTAQAKGAAARVAAPAQLPFDWLKARVGHRAQAGLGA
jgi:hypothetical protein